ncbi:protein of unknown function [Petrocella atlantisensis]|uniref:Uncharacterized protein n=1 Tax=Petrocella atlantisensis TaxID=2173034 RepID=A0A3P7S3V4_9FIRM|nr:hypothetical protein [Petrocella atlantisensis]VDN47319.1 protein of unknown function [Petrocella atlantisensis]
MKETKETQMNQNKNQKKKKMAMILGIIAILLLMSIYVIAPILKGTFNKDIPTQPELDRNVIGSGDQQQDSDPDEEALLQEEVTKNTLNARIASALQPDENGLIYLSLKNRYEDKLLQVVIVNEETEEIYYTSPVLEPMMDIEYDKITNHPPKGEYPCIAYFYYYTMDEEPISHVGAQIKLIIE